MATHIRTDDLPAWAQEAVRHGRLTGDFRDLADLLRGPTAGHDPSTLADDQRRRLYELAKPVFMAEALRFYAHFRSGQLGCAYRLHELAKRLRPQFDLRVELEMTGTDWDALAYMSRVHEVARRYRNAQEGSGYAKRDLAEHVLDKTPLEFWEYGAERLEVIKLAREGLQPRLEAAIADCRQGDFGQAAWLQEALEGLGYRQHELYDLGFTPKELAGWVRQNSLRGIRFQIGASLDGDEFSLFLNSKGSLLCMLKHGIKPEEAGIDRAALTTARDRLAAWLPRAIRRPHEETGNMFTRESLQEYQELVLPLFDQVLAL